jgi:predicted transposase YdaD
VAPIGGEVTEALDEWVYYLKHNEVLASFRAKGMQQIAQQLAYDALPPKLQLEYDKELDRLRGLNVAVESAKMEGMELGRAEGARSKALETARNFKALGILSAEQIARATGLTTEEIAAL